MAGMAPSVRVDIGELVLHGVEAGERDAVAEAFRKQLERLFPASNRDGAFLIAGGGSPHVDAGDVHVPEGGASAMGAAVGRAVHAALVGRGPG